MKLSEKEMRTLVDRLRQCRAGLPVLDTEALALWKWAHETKTSALLLEMTLAGELLVDVNESGEVKFFTAVSKE